MYAEEVENHREKGSGSGVVEPSVFSKIPGRDKRLRKRVKFVKTAQSRAVQHDKSSKIDDEKAFFGLIS